MACDVHDAVVEAGPWWWTCLTSEWSGSARRAGGVVMYAGSGDIADGVEVGVRVAMALGWERPRGEAVEGHGQRWLIGVAV